MTTAGPAGGAQATRLKHCPPAFGIVNLAFARAWLDVLRGRRIEAWSGLEWERPGQG